MALAKQIQDEGPSAVERYLDFCPAAPATIRLSYSRQPVLI